MYEYGKETLTLLALGLALLAVVAFIFYAGAIIFEVSPYGGP